MHPQTHTTRLIVFLIIALVCMAGASLLFGAASISPMRVIGCIADGLLRRENATAEYQIVIAARLPRVIMAALVGATLALTGLATQTLFRNPLASPFTLGISNGAALGAVIGMLLAAKIVAQPSWLVPALSLLGGLGTLALVVSLSSGQSGATLLLSGIGVAAMWSAATSGAMFIAGQRLETVVFWLMGGLWRSGWHEVWLMLPVTLACFGTLQYSANSLNVWLLGNHAARDLGVHTKQLQRITLLVIGIGTAVAVSLTGTIGFIGLIVPHLLRICIGANHRSMIPATAIGGALLLILADTFARTLAAPAEIPVGVVTALLGAPLYLWMLRRSLRGVA